MEDNNLQGIISMFSEERGLQYEYENRCIDNLISIDLGKNIKKGLISLIWVLKFKGIKCTRKVFKNYSK